MFQVPTLCGHLLFSGPHFVCYTKTHPQGYYITSIRLTLAEVNNGDQWVHPSGIIHEPQSVNSDPQCIFTDRGHKADTDTMEQSHFNANHIGRVKLLPILYTCLSESPADRR